MENIAAGPFLSRVAQLQSELKAPKDQTNKFGNYKYRSCEDILEAAKPLLLRHDLVLTIGDQIVQIGERYYIRAEASLRDAKGTDKLTNTAFAREAKEKKGMDESQITGMASSYARKYALNGLLCINDTKDADTGEPPPAKKDPPPSQHVCNCCGRPIQPRVNNDGEVVKTADEVASYTMDSFGETLCYACMAQRINAGKKGA